MLYYQFVLEHPEHYQIDGLVQERCLLILWLLALLKPHQALACSVYSSYFPVNFNRVNCPLMLTKKEGCSNCTDIKQA